MNGLVKKRFALAETLLNCCVILPPAFLYTVKSDHPHYFLITLAILLFAAAEKRYMPLTDRPVIYSIVAAIALTGLPDIAITIEDTRFGLFDLLLRSNLAIPVIVYAGALSCMFSPYPARLGFTAGCSAASLLICGDRFNYERLTNTILPFLDGILQNYTTAYIVCVAIAVPAIPFMFITGSRLNEKESRVPSPAHGLLWSRIARAVCILLIPLFAIAGAKFYFANQKLIRTLEYYFLRMGVRQYRPYHSGGERLLSNSVDLNVTLPEYQGEDRSAVMLRVKSDFPPGYLRGGVYTFYNSGQWKKTPAQEYLLPVQRRAEIVSYSTFTVGAPREEDAPSRKLEIFLAGLRSGGLVPVPGNVFRIEAVADDADMADGILSLRLWKADGGCTAYVPPVSGSQAWPEPLDPVKDKNLTAVPDTLRTRLELFAHEPGTRAGGDRAEVDRLTNVFLRDFKYSLTNSNAVQGEDPVIRFLMETHTGHCEYFASAAVLLLRSRGMPARYVTGFICEEKSMYGDYYVSRAEHAHAWAEVYLRDEKRWITVDMTPPDVLAEMRSRERSQLKSMLDMLIQQFQEFFANVRRGYFAEAILGFLAGILSLLWKFAKTPYGMVLIAAVLFLYGRHILRRLRARPKNAVPEEMRRLAAVFEKFEKKYAAKTKKVRPPNFTIHEYYASSPAAGVCLRYEVLRYGGKIPSADEIRDIENAFAGCLRGMK